MMPKTILVFNGGGLSPALNSLLYGVIKEAQSRQWKIWGGLMGWASLLEDGVLIDLTNFDIEKIKDAGGTFLRSSRTNPLKVPNGLGQIKEKIKKHNIQAMAVIGGDDTLGTAYLLYDQLDIPIVGIPKTIDNDLSETYWTPGFPSAAFNFADFVRRVKIHAAYTLSRIFIVEAPGFKSGWLTACGAYGLADVILPPEKMVSSQRVVERVAESYFKNGNYAVVAISQYARFDKPIIGMADDQNDQYHDQTGRNYFIGLSFTDFLKSELRLDVRSLHPGNYIESADPIKIDRDYANLLGQKAVSVLEEGKTGLAVCLKRPDKIKLDLQIETCSLEDMVGRGRYHFLPEIKFDFENFQVKPEFFNYMEPILGKNPASIKDTYLELQKEINELIK